MLRRRCRGRGGRLAPGGRPRQPVEGEQRWMWFCPEDGGPYRSRNLAQINVFQPTGLFRLIEIFGHAFRRGATHRFPHDDR